MLRTAEIDHLPPFAIFIKIGVNSIENCAKFIPFLFVYELCLTLGFLTTLGHFLRPLAVICFF